VPTPGSFGAVAFTIPSKWRPDQDETHYRDVLVGSVLVPARWLVDASTGEVTIEPFSGGGAGEWCRLGFSDDYVIPAGGRNIVVFDLEANHDPTFYNIVRAAPSPGGTRNAIEILQDGVYAVTWGLYLDVFTPLIPTNSKILVSFEHTTWTHEEEAFIFPVLLDDLATPSDDSFYDLASPIITGTKVFRSGPDFDPVYMAVTTAAGTTGSIADSDLGIIGGDLNISYMEVVRLNSAAAGQTDPNDSITGP
jgi:hypothetical protein